MSFIQSGDQTPFIDLPAGLVEEVLSKTAGVSENLLESFQEVRGGREKFHQDLVDNGMILYESSLECPTTPTTCAADGSYAIERMLAIDLVAAAAVVVEGLTPPSEKRFWDQPRHIAYVESEPHHEDIDTVLRSVMLGEELELLAKAPHEVLMMDGTLTLPIIYFNQALNKAPEVRGMKCADIFLDKCKDYLKAYLTILESKRSDKNFVGLPKYSTRREIGKKLNWPNQYDDRGLLTLVLNPGELTKPRILQQDQDADGNATWHINTGRLQGSEAEEISEIANSIVHELSKVRVVYYKPKDWLPALRLEVSSSIAQNKARLATVIHGIKSQTATPSMLEPYPIYMADRTVKSLSRALPAFRQVATQQISKEYNGDIGEVYFAMHGYRSESGR